MKAQHVLMEKLVLASSSPRRAEILRAVGWPFEVMVAAVDEARWPTEDAVSYVKRLAYEKASTVAKKVTNKLVLGADTVVVINEQVLGQPRHEEDARRMLRLLSGTWHEVLTGVALVRAGDNAPPVIDYVRTGVKFAKVSEDEIASYVASGEPMDKAGAYAIQGRAALFIEAVEGDYFNIVGLPVRRIYEVIQNMRHSLLQ